MDIPDSYRDYPGTIVGIDEVGMGAIAGPVTVAAVAIEWGAVSGVRDSKRVAESRRGYLAHEIRRKAEWTGVASRGVADVNERGVNRCAAECAVELALAAGERFGDAVCVLMDGAPDSSMAGYIRKRVPRLEFVQGGDSSVYQISAASLVAKVHRDAVVTGYDSAWIGWGFGKHKGYGTEEHLAVLKRAGPIEGVHRRKPVNKILVKKPRTKRRIEEERTKTLELSPAGAKVFADVAWDHEALLSDWERGFVSDLRRKLGVGCVLTPRQHWYLRDVATRVQRRYGKSEKWRSMATIDGEPVVSKEED